MAQRNVLPASFKDEGSVTAKPGDFEPQENSGGPQPDDRPNPPTEGPELSPDTSQVEVRHKAVAQR